MRQQRRGEFSLQTIGGVVVVLVISGAVCAFIYDNNKGAATANPQVKEYNLKPYAADAGTGSKPQVKESNPKKQAVSTGTGSEDDALSRRLVGTWENPVATNWVRTAWADTFVPDRTITFTGTDTYFPDKTHTFAGTVTIDGKTSALSWNTKWRIENKRIIFKTTHCNLPEVAKVGEIDINKILKLTDDEFTIQDMDEDIETVRRIRN